MKFINANNVSAIDIGGEALKPDLMPGNNLELNGTTWFSITEEQAVSAKNVLLHQGRENFEGAHYDTMCECLMLKFKYILIGVEPDGYAHS